MREKLSEKQEIALAALVCGETRAKAAQAAKVSESTVFRWLNEKMFRDRLKAARQRVFDDASGKIFNLSDSAIATLERNLNCKNPAIEVRAAVAVLTAAARFRDSQVLDRLEKLERLFEGENYAEFNESDSET